MTAHARIRPEPWADRIAVYLINDIPGGPRIITYPNSGGPGVDTSTVVDPGTEPTPSLHLDDDMALTLLDALASHYRRATDTGTLRADYEHTRRRLDTVTDAIIAAHRDLPAHPAIARQEIP